MLGSAAVFGATPLALGVPAGALVALLTDGIFRPASNTLYPTISHGPRNARTVALTFDDGPDATITPRVLDILGEHGARATFFMIGRNLERSIGIGERAIREGHQIGNHSWKHGYFQHASSVRAQLADMERSEELIRGITGQTMRSVYRCPVGLKSPRFARVAHLLSLKVIAWSVHSRDTIDQNPERIARRVLSRVQSGDIVLMHDGHQSQGSSRTSALRALPRVLEGLKERNLQPVTLDEMLG